jgi:glycosyltransferase involved in cell wall biosynthesis
MKPFLSILIPTFNRALMTIEAVKSVGHNPEVEIVVVDDCSDDIEFGRLVYNLDITPNRKIFSNHSNIGMTRNFNRCMGLAQGDWLGLIGSDDYYKPGAIDRAVELLHTLPPSLVVYARSSVGRISPPGIETVRSMRLPSGSGNFWHRSIYEDLGGFDERLTFSPDGEYWYRIATKYPVVESPEKYSVYREHGNNLMYDTWRQRDEFLKQIKLITRLNMVHRGEDVDDLDAVAASEMKSVWDTISYILRVTANKPDKHDIFDMYIGKGASMANTKERADVINQLKRVRMEG